MLLCILFRFVIENFIVLYVMKLVMSLVQNNYVLLLDQLTKIFVSMRTYVLDMYSLTSQPAEHLTEVIIDILTRCDLDIKYIRGQGYDSASAMAGRLAGASTRIRSMCKKAFYVHCSTHSLDPRSIMPDRNLVNYGGKRQTCTIIVYDRHIRCLTIYYDDRKLLL